MSDVANSVMNIIGEQMGIPVEQLKPENDLVHDLGADVLHLVELVMSLEEKFEIEIPDEEFEKLATIQAVIDYILDSI
jgi:acyl carrier protein